MDLRGLGGFVVAPVRRDRTFLTKRAYVRMLYYIHMYPLLYAYTWFHLVRG